MILESHARASVRLAAAVKPAGLAAALWLCTSAHPALSDDSPPLFATGPGLLVETAWDEAVPAVEDEAASGTKEAPLAERVLALENTIRELEAQQAEKPAKEPSAEPSKECTPKQIEIIEKPTYKWRGRLYVDGIAYDDDDETSEFFDTDRENEFGFDTARIGVQGDIYENIAYVVEVEFEGTEVDFKDVFAEMHSLPVVGNFRAGHFKEPIGLEELTSSRFDTFMEQSYATAAFTPARNYGVMLFDALDASDDATWFLGTFRHNSDDSPNAIATQRDDRNDWSLASRLAWLPYYDEPSEGRYLVHTGISYRYGNGNDDPLSPARFDRGAYIGNQPPIGVGVNPESDNWNQVGAEFAVVWGALSFQTEYFHAFVTSGEEYDGAYVQFSYFLTGEHRGYDKPTKSFYRVHPFEPAFWIDAHRGCCYGRGAWELTTGYSYADLEDGEDLDTGRLERAFVDGAIFGVNWYLNPYSRVMFNYSNEITDFVAAGTPDSNANIFGVRWQIDW